MRGPHLWTVNPSHVTKSTFFFNYDDRHGGDAKRELALCDDGAFGIDDLLTVGGPLFDVATFNVLTMMKGYYDTYFPKETKAPGSNSSSVALFPPTVLCADSEIELPDFWRRATTEQDDDNNR